MGQELRLYPGCRRVPLQSSGAADRSFNRHAAALRLVSIGRVFDDAPSMLRACSEEAPGMLQVAEKRKFQTACGSIEYAVTFEYYLFTTLTA
jgi:hypothetical protein